MVLLDLPSRPRGAVCPPLDPPGYVSWSRYFAQNSRFPALPQTGKRSLQESATTRITGCDPCGFRSTIPGSAPPG